MKIIQNDIQIIKASVQIVNRKVENGARNVHI